MKCRHLYIPAKMTICTLDEWLILCTVHQIAPAVCFFPSRWHQQLGPHTLGGSCAIYWLSDRWQQQSSPFVHQRAALLSVFTPPERWLHQMHQIIRVMDIKQTIKMNHLFCCSVFDKTKFDNYDQSKLEAQYSVCIVCLIDKTYCVLYIVFVKCKIIT